MAKFVSEISKLGEQKLQTYKKCAAQFEDEFRVWVWFSWYICFQDTADVATGRLLNLELDLEVRPRTEPYRIH